MILQQSADFWLRFDCYYTRYPYALLQTLDMTPAERAAWSARFLDPERTPPCCLDAHCSLKLQERGAEAPDLPTSAAVRGALQCVDQDDSCTTTVENERQHGRMRCEGSRNATKKDVPRTICQALLAEWSLEHAGRGFSGLSPQDTEERLRAVALKVGQQGRQGRVGYKSARLRYADRMDAADCAAGRRQRTRRAMSENKKRRRDEWDNMSDGRSTKRRFVEEFRPSARSPRGPRRRLRWLCDGVQGPGR